MPVEEEASPASSASPAAPVAILDASYRLSALVSAADAVVPGFGRFERSGRSGRSARSGRADRADRAERADREDPVCVYVEGAWCVYALHVLVQYEPTDENEAEADEADEAAEADENEPRWESAHTYHGTRMWREFVAVRPEWADLAHEYKPDEAEQLAKDRAGELSSDESDESDAALPPLEPVCRREGTATSATSAMSAMSRGSPIETELAD